MYFHSGHSPVLTCMFLCWPLSAVSFLHSSVPFTSMPASDGRTGGCTSSSVSRWRDACANSQFSVSNFTCKYCTNIYVQHLSRCVWTVISRLFVMCTSGAIAGTMWEDWRKDGCIEWSPCVRQSMYLVRCWQAFPLVFWRSRLREGAWKTGCGNAWFNDVQASASNQAG